MALIREKQKKKKRNFNYISQKVPNGGPLGAKNAKILSYEFPVEHPYFFNMFYSCMKNSY